MNRTLLAVVMLAALAACGAPSTASTAQSSTPAPDTSTASTPTTTAPPPSAFTTATPGCATFDVDLAIKQEDGTWTGTISSWCAVPGKATTQADLAQQTVDSERAAGGFVECDLIAPDAQNPQFTAWANDLSATGKPVLHHVIAAIGNC